MNNRRLSICFCAILFGISSAAVRAQQPAGEKTERNTLVVRLKYAEAMRLAQTMTDVIRAGDDDNVTIVPETVTNSLIVSAAPETFDQLESLIEVFDVETAVREKPITEVLPLSSMDASHCAQVLQSIYGDQHMVRLTVDAKSNSLIVHAPRAALEEITALVEKLGATQRTRETQVKMFSLQHVEPDENLQSILSTILQSANARLAVDAARNAVVVHGEKSVLDTVEALLVRLDQPSAQAERKSSVSLQVRVVWLVSGAKSEAAQKPGDDLAEVTAELAKIGFVDPVVAANLVVNSTLGGSRFQLSGAAQLDESWILDISGQIHPTADLDRSTLDIQIQAVNRDVAGKGDACNLSTTISAPIGDIVVLGVSPLENMTSAFVVQVSAPQPAAARRR